jgi:hypothetical protein
MPAPTRLPGIRVARGPGSMAELAPRWAAAVYGIIGYPIRMVKTTVYLPEDLKERLEEAARVSGDSEARIIRSAIEGWLESLLPRPRSRMLGTIEFGDPDLPFKVDEIMAEGFGLQ